MPASQPVCFINTFPREPRGIIVDVAWTSPVHMFCCHSPMNRVNMRDVFWRIALLLTLAGDFSNALVSLSSLALGLDCMMLRCLDAWMLDTPCSMLYVLTPFTCFYFMQCLLYFHYKLVCIATATLTLVAIFIGVALFCN